MEQDEGNLSQGMPAPEPRPLGPPQAKACGVIFSPRRVGFLVDGLNLERSLDEAEKVTGRNFRWLDLRKLCLRLARSFDADARLVSIDYFGARPGQARHSDPAEQDRQRLFLRTLAEQGEGSVRCHWGRMVNQWIIPESPPNLRVRIRREKGTDVGLAIKVLELAHGDALDDAIILSGDTDYEPLVGAMGRMHPEKSVRFALPFRRTPTLLLHASPPCLRLTPDVYAECLLPRLVVLRNGRKLHCPSEWRDPAADEGMKGTPLP